MLGEEWVIYESVRCQELYFSCLRELFRLMKERREYEEMLELCNTVIDIYPFEEWQTVQIDCMIAMNRYQDAMKAYEDASVLYFEEFGVTPSGKMLAQFQILSGKIQYAQEAILDIQKSLSEKGETNGPYYCSYPSFVDIYRIVKRIVERSGQSVFLMLCWICSAKNIPLENEKLIQESSACLQKAMSKSLRRGDVYTKHSANQFLLLLMGTNQESCALISDRIDRNYRNGSIERKTKIRYYALSVADVYQEDPEENSFQIKGDKQKSKVKHIAL